MEQIGKAIKALSPDKRKNEVLKRIEIYLRFIEFVSDENGLFYNFVKPDRTIDHEFNQKENLEDANGRTLWALAVVATTEALPDTLRQRAFSLLKRRMDHPLMIESPRATAFYVKGLCLLLKNPKEINWEDFKQRVIRCCDRLVSLYRGVSSKEWEWFETYLTYSNAVVPEALLLGHQQTGNSDFLEIGIKTLDFLIAQTFLKGIYMPIGQDGWHHKTEDRRYFDQQPEDASAMACALSTAYSITGKQRSEERRV